LRTENVTTAVLFRLTDSQTLSLLTDEYDSSLWDNEELRGALNAGQKCGGVFLRCEGESNKLRAFKTFAPVALAGIGSLPGTLADRSIIIHMQRAKPGELRQRFDSRKTAREQELKRKLIRWSQDNYSTLQATDPELPGLYNRKADTWRPLFAIAECVGGEWPERVKKAVTELAAKSDESESAGVLLLADIRTIFTSRSKDDWLPSAEIIDELLKREDAPWQEWHKGKPITQAAIARLLKPFGIRPKQHCYEDRRAGISSYERISFDNAFSRYLVSDEPSKHDESPNQTSTSLQTPIINGLHEYQTSTESK
jgi:hypothetical protein